MSDNDCTNEIPTKRGITLWGGVTFVVGSIIGTGIFSNGGRILELAGSPGMTMLLWALGAFVAFCGGFSYVEWGTRIPASGGDLPYLSFVYGKHSPLPFLYMWYRVVLALPGTTAALATTVGKYSIHAFPLPDNLSAGQKEWVVKAIAVATILSLFLLCAFSNAIAKNGIKYITFFKMLVVAFVFCSGLAAVKNEDLKDCMWVSYSNHFYYYYRALVQFLH